MEKWLYNLNSSLLIAKKSAGILPATVRPSLATFLRLNPMLPLLERGYYWLLIRYTNCAILFAISCWSASRCSGRKPHQNGPILWSFWTQFEWLLRSGYWGFPIQFAKIHFDLKFDLSGYNLTFASILSCYTMTITAKSQAITLLYAK